ncbi:MAG: SpoIIE family protein phosphatase [Clostridia bacterium]
MQFDTSTGAAAMHAKAARKKPRFALLAARAPAFLKASAQPLTIAACMFLLPFVRWFGIPSPFAAALLLAREGRSSPFALVGLSLSLVLRLLWGVPTDIWQYAGCLLLWLLLLRCRPKPGIESAALGGLAMMPRAVATLVSGTPLDMLLSLAAVPVCMLAAVCLRSGLATLESESAPPRAKEQAGVLLLCLLMVSALGYFQLLSINLGFVAAVLCTALVACASGVARGAAIGLFCGLSLAFGGHDCRVAFSLSLIGLFCGLPMVARKRWLCIPAAITGNLLAIFTTPFIPPTISWWVLAVGIFAALLLPGRALEYIRAFAVGVPQPVNGMESTFVTQRITYLQDAVQRVAKALPREEETSLTCGEELGALLCAQCANRELCWGRSRARTERMLDIVAELSHDGKAIDEAHLPALAEHGCLRMDALSATAQKAGILRKKRRAARTKARFERELTLTHLAAMSGTLGELSVLAAGESLNDLHAAHTIRVAIDELRLPLRLCYARRVDGHLQAAVESEGMLPIQKPLEALLRHLTEADNLALNISSMQKGRVELEELPLYSAAVGTASLCAGQRTEKEEAELCGDACVAKRCEGGRLLMMLSDGMGHGEEAHKQSEKTLELLLLLLEAGYTRRQAITAVNGIMLSAQEEERYSTVDLADIDLWTGEVYSEKLGACATWIVRGNHMKKVEGASLPLGVMEEAAPTPAQYRLHSGDILVLMSDGITDVFHDDEQMQVVLEESLYIQPQRMADALLRNALLASGGTPRDDMSVMVMLMMDRQRAGA